MVIRVTFKKFFLWALDSDIYNKSKALLLVTHHS